MNDEEIKKLQESFKTNKIIWREKDRMFIKVISIQEHKEEYNDLCAFLENGTYIHLYSADVKDFFIIKEIF